MLQYPYIPSSQPSVFSQTITWSGLVDLLVREPLARLEVLLLERRIEDAHAADLAGARGVVAPDVCLLFAVGGLDGGGSGVLVGPALARYVELERGMEGWRGREVGEVEG